MFFNYALTLEHLESAFYRDGLAEFDGAAFEEAGFDPEVRENLERIAGHEADHVDAITAAIEAAGGVRRRRPSTTSATTTSRASSRLPRRWRPPAPRPTPAPPPTSRTRTCSPRP